MGTIIVGTILVLCGVYGVFEGIHSRVEAKAALRQVALNSAIPSVDVVYPKGGAEAEEIELLGNTEAFTDTPIYARTNGYVKQWYVDIGARVQQGQLLAVIETPELDQQLRQATAGVARNSHVALLPITIGQDYGSAVEVLSGLTVRDALIVNPSDSLANGAQVQVEEKLNDGARQ